jgi:hypothetical protein
MYGVAAILLCVTVPALSLFLAALSRFSEPLLFFNLTS